MSRRSKGEGSLTQRNGGRWQGSIQVDRKRTCVYGMTRREAYLKLQRLRMCLLPGDPMPNAPRITVNQLLDRWFEAISPASSRLPLPSIGRSPTSTSGRC